MSHWIQARKAQLVAYQLGTRKVPGSNPGKGDNFSVKISNWIVWIWIWIFWPAFGCYALQLLVKICNTHTYTIYYVMLTYQNRLNVLAKPAWKYWTYLWLWINAPSLKLHPNYNIDDKIQTIVCLNSWSRVFHQKVFAGPYFRHIFRLCSCCLQYGFYQINYTW